MSSLIVQRFILLLVLFNTLTFLGQSTASQQVMTFDIEAPQLPGERRIWVYVPQRYDATKEAFPVMYMFDGQNIFDKESSYAGEWGVDEYLDTIKADHIVVAIDHGNEERLNELTPYQNPEYGGGEGDLFLEFIITRLKPYIDANFRTITNAGGTSIAGASLGGLMAYYALIKHQDVFSKAIALSPSFWINPEIKELTEKTRIKDSSKFYIVIGADEGELMISAYQPILEVLLNKELTPQQYYMELVEGGRHNEEFWQAQFKQAYRWLFK